MIRPDGERTAPGLPEWSADFTPTQGASIHSGDTYQDARLGRQTDKVSGYWESCRDGEHRRVSSISIAATAAGKVSNLDEFFTSFCCRCRENRQ
jgi:hypothetical protein